MQSVFAITLGKKMAQKNWSL